MNGNAPETILTDQNMWLTEAIAAEMPRTKHAFCIWHIIVKFTNWFSVLLGSRYDQWRAEFRQLYDLHSVEDFEVGWKEMVDKYGLPGNKLIISLYALHTLWALPYMRCYFFAGMTNAFQSELINSFIRQFLSVQFHSDNFVEQVAAIVDLKDEAGGKQKIQWKVQKISQNRISNGITCCCCSYTICLQQTTRRLVLAP